MSCNKDEYCKTIVDNYKEQIGELNSGFSSIENSLNNMNSSFNSLSIPDDYLGSKVKDAISNMSKGFGELNMTISNCKKDAISFAEEKKSEHQLHYDEWLQRKEEKD